MKTSNMTVAVAAIIGAVGIGTLGAPVTIVLGGIALCGAELLHHELQKIPKKI